MIDPSGREEHKQVHIKFQLRQEGSSYMTGDHALCLSPDAARSTYST
jgi:hypothetical protein